MRCVQGTMLRVWQDRPLGEERAGDRSQRIAGAPTGSEPLLLQVVTTPLRRSEPFIVLIIPGIAACGCVAHSQPARPGGKEKSVSI